jgi:hypothetical protein
MRRVVAVVLLALGPGADARGQGADECIVLEDFARSKVGEFPAGWTVRREEGRPMYAVQQENGRRFLHAASKGLGIQAVLPLEWDLAQYPFLAWSWRPLEFPRGADERHGGTNDSALAVYLLVPYSRIRGPKAVKYIWSERLPSGERLSSNLGLTQVLVLESGPARRGRWVEERVNALEDFKAYFGESSPPKPGGIAVLTDSDDTQSMARGDYADFRACRR